VTNNNGFWIGWLDLLTPYFTISFTLNQYQERKINDCLRLAPFCLRLRLSFLLLGLLLTYEWLKNDSVCTAECLLRVRVRVTLRLTVYRKSVCLGFRPLETHDQYFFLNEHLRLESLCNILSDERMSLSFIIAGGQRSHSPLRRAYFTVSHSRLPQPGGPGPRVYIPRNRVAQLYPQALGWECILICMAAYIV
jgi:hypothetical protein